MSDPADASEAAASEMAAPIRELHRPVVINDYQDQQADLAKARNVIEQVRDLHDRYGLSPSGSDGYPMWSELGRILADAEGSGQ